MTPKYSHFLNDFEHHTFTHIPSKRTKIKLSDLPNMLPKESILLPALSTNQIPINVQRQLTAFGTHTSQMANSTGKPAIFSILAL